MKFFQLDLNKSTAWAELQMLAQTPFDLTGEGVLSAGRIERFSAKAAGLTLSYATERVDEKVVAALGALADEMGVVEQLALLHQGAVMNTVAGEGENRRVLHYASRNLFGDLPDPPPAKMPEDAVADGRAEMEKLEGFIRSIETGERVNAQGQPFTDLVHIGIGGSTQGPAALFHAMGAYQQRRVHFVSNVDPDHLASVFHGLDLSRTLVAIVSKSGSTLETLANQTQAETFLQKANLKPEEHLLAITGRGSAMDDPTAFLQVFHMFDYVGGRFSGTSMVGALPLAFGLGWDHLKDILKGAREMDLACLSPRWEDNPALVLAALRVWNRTFLQHPALVIAPYSQSLQTFLVHLQQLEMESNGKSVSRGGKPLDYLTSPVVWGGVGTNAQHAFFQMLHQSDMVVPAEFIGFEESQWGEDQEIEGSTSQEKLNANLVAQSLALATGRSHPSLHKNFPGNRPSHVLMAKKLSPRMLGVLLALYENMVALEGFFWNINSFDQEGVELGKNLAQEFLKNPDHPFYAAMLKKWGGKI